MAPAYSTLCLQGASRQESGFQCNGERSWSTCVSKWVHLLLCWPQVETRATRPEALCGCLPLRSLDQEKVPTFGGKQQQLGEGACLLPGDTGFSNIFRTENQNHADQWRGWSI